MGDTRGETSRSPLWAALDAEVIALERMVARAWQALAIVAILIAVVVAIFITPEMGKALAITSGLGLAWFTTVRALLDRGVATRAIRMVSPLFEMSVPAIALIVIARTQGAAYALSSWVPPILFALILLVTVLRLDPRLPLAMGVLAALEYLATYVLELRFVSYERIDEAIARPSMQMVRATSIVLMGVAGTVATVGLRRAIGLAAKRSRATDLFGKYRLGKQIAAGGMGTVFEALYCPEGGFERKVAIKRVHPHLAKDGVTVQSFREEAELGARLAHPNIVAVLDFGITEDTYFFAMEHVDGMDLHRLRKACKAAGVVIPTPIIAFIAREIAEGIAFAHEAAQSADGRLLRVIHRDLNPSNVLLSRNGQVKISDFGIAKALRDSGAYETGTLVGKVPYFAPEQARGEAVDERVDLYALGLVIWELLCRRPLWSRQTDAETLLAIMHATPPLPSTLRPELAGGPWDELCRKALEAEPIRRFQSAREMSAALTKILDAEGMPRSDDLAKLVRDAETWPLTSTDDVSATSNPTGSDAKTVREPA